jgi:hypothetical protein
MKSLFIKERIAYDGTQLRSLFAYLDHKVMGDSIVAWRGACSISFEHMVDGEDLLEQSPIAGADMLHFIIEKFHTDLRAAVFLQRYFAAQVMELLRERLAALGKASQAMELSRGGDDIYWQGGKLSISIATVSPVSGLVHFAMNVKNEGAPVKTAALSDFFSEFFAAGASFDAEVARFGADLAARFAAEIDSADQAATKVRWVK